MARTLVIGFCVIGAMLALVLATQGWGLGALPDGQPSWPMLLEDESDRSAYQLRGRWLPAGAVPYLQEHSEYPQLTTWAMALPYLVMDHGIQRGEPFGSAARLTALFATAGLPADAAERCLKELRSRPWREGAVHEPQSLAGQWAERVLAVAPSSDRAEVTATLDAAWRAQAAWRDELARNRVPYGDRHQILMALLYGLLLCVTASNLRCLGHAPAWALLLCLPGGLFFAFSRFDLLVTLLVALAVHAHLRDRPALAALWLGAAVMTKWYPAVLVPIFLSHDLRRLSDEARAAGRRLALGATLRRYVLLPGLVLAAVIGGVLALTWSWGDGGLPALRYLFDWHRETRQPNYSALLTALTDQEQLGWLPASVRPTLQSWFSVLQLLPGLLLALLPLRSPRAFLLACLSATLCSVLFSRFFSPQWIVWGTALTILVAPRMRWILLLALPLELLAYLQVPVFHYHAQVTGDFEGFQAVNRVRQSLLVLFVLVAAVLTLRAALARRAGGETADVPATG